MSIVSYRCPHCGADIAFEEGQDTICPYCESHIVNEDIVGKDELEYLRRSSAQLERKTHVEAEYFRQLRNWKVKRAGYIAAIAATVAAGFLLVGYDHTGLGVLSIFIALGVFLVCPLTLGMKYPVYNTETSEITYRSGSNAGMIFRLYLAGIVTGFTAMFATAVLAITVLGLDSDDEEQQSSIYIRERKYTAAEYTDSDEEADTAPDIRSV